MCYINIYVYYYIFLYLFTIGIIYSEFDKIFLFDFCTTYIILFFYRSNVHIYIYQKTHISCHSPIRGKARLREYGRNFGHKLDFQRSILFFRILPEKKMLIPWSSKDASKFKATIHTQSIIFTYNWLVDIV